MTVHNGFIDGQLEIPSYLTEILDDSAIESLSKTSLGDGNSIPVFLSRFATTEPDTNDPLLGQCLEVICRKLSVLRMVRTSYDSDWQMAIEKKPLGIEWWPLMLYLLLTLPDTTKSGPGNALGLALKWINAALIGIELARELGASEVALSELTDLAERRLDTLIGVRI
jgi:hypothetical protein